VPTLRLNCDAERARRLERAEPIQIWSARAGSQADSVQEPSRSTPAGAQMPSIVECASEPFEEQHAKIPALLLAEKHRRASEATPEATASAGAFPMRRSIASSRTFRAAIMPFANA
jgi:hypothetical protein